MHDKRLESELTGKFTMVVVYNDQMNQELQINVELKNGGSVSEGLEKYYLEAVKNQLLLEVSEYRKTYEEKGDLVLPKIIFWPYESQNYFRPGIKQKWVKK